MKIKHTLAVGLALTAFLLPINHVHADSRSQGVDLAKYQGNTAVFGKASDQFAICQIGGYDYGLYDESTYNSQVASCIAQGKRAHTYIWDQVGDDMNAGIETINYFLPRIQTPKGSIVALDYEAGASGNVEGNTNVIIKQMEMLKNAGYTPVYYSYKGYTQTYVDYNRILSEFPNRIWLAAYPHGGWDHPDYNYFPSLNGVGMWQFDDDYNGKNVDGDVDLLNITYAGYKSNSVPKHNTSVTKQGEIANDTPKRDIEKGYTVKINFSAKNYATGQPIPNWIKGHAYPVAQVSGDKVLLGQINSWLYKKDVEILQTKQQAATNNAPTTNNNLIEDYAQHGVFYPSCTLNVRTQPSINAPIVTQYHAGDSLIYDHVYIRDGYVWARYLGNSGYYRYVAMGIMGGQQFGKRQSNIANTYVVRNGDTLSGISNKLGVSISSLCNKNGIANCNLIYPGEKLIY